MAGAGSAASTSVVANAPAPTPSILARAIPVATAPSAAATAVVVVGIGVAVGGPTSAPARSATVIAHGSGAAAGRRPAVANWGGPDAGVCGRFPATGGIAARRPRTIAGTAFGFAIA